MELAAATYRRLYKMYTGFGWTMGSSVVDLGRFWLDTERVQGGSSMQSAAFGQVGGKSGMG